MGGEGGRMVRPPSATRLARTSCVFQPEQLHCASHASVPGNEVLLYLTFNIRQHHVLPHLPERVSQTLQDVP